MKICRQNVFSKKRLKKATGFYIDQYYQYSCMDIIVLVLLKENLACVSFYYEQQQQNLQKIFADFLAQVLF